MTSFSELGIGKRLCAAVAGMGWNQPTPIQVAAIPEGMSGRDMFGQKERFFQSTKVTIYFEMDVIY